ncbi:protease inhibitor I42 family protein [Streptomyces sp. NPDC032940]|uniref:protease inhibitor I42 family protein n=1 Tax=Streptomyces sp. NPDC032940 TaxID=3155366 RepID=UPI0033DA14FB
MISSTRTAFALRGSRGGAAVAAAALLALAAGCGSQGTSSRPADGTGITAEPGERFTLTVDQNASTREYWYLVGPAPDSSVLVPRGRDYAPASGDEPMPGAAGRLTFTFEAKGEGTTRFTLLHCTFSTCRGNTATRPPEASGPSSAASPAPERITYTVTVG